MKTRNGLPKYCSYNKDRHGTRRVMFRRRGFATYLTGTPWSDDFMRQYAVAIDGLKAQWSNVGSRANHFGFIRCLGCFLLSQPRISWAESQHASRAPEHQSSCFGTSMATSLLLDWLVFNTSRPLSEPKPRLPRRQTICSRCCASFWAFAVDQGLIETNPAMGVKRYKS